MSIAHDKEVVVLESQTQLIEGLQEQTRLQSNIIRVEGVEGSGKSWLAQRFLNTDSEVQTLSFLMCVQTQTVEQQRSVLMSQLLADSFCTGEESLVESLTEYRKDQECKATIIVDDAELLAPSLLSELCELVTVAKNEEQWQINVLFFAKESALNLDVQDVEFKSVTISPFNDVETRLFLDSVVIAEGTSEQEQDSIYLAATKVEKTPAQLLTLSSKTVAKPCGIRRILLAVLAVIIVALIWTMFSGDDKSEQETVEPAQESQQLEQSATQAQNADKDESAQSVDENSDAAAKEVSFDDQMPQDVTDETLTVGDDEVEEQKRVVVPADVVDSLIDGKSPEKTTTKANMHEHLDQQVPSDVATKLDNQALLAVSSKRYTLQIGAFTSEAYALKLVESNGLTGDARVYSTQRDQKTMYIVTYKDFSSVKSTVEASSELPESLQQAKPWAKSLAQVHQEIKSAQ